MTLPNFVPKENSTPLLTAAERLRNVKLPSPPPWLIFCPQASLVAHAVKRWRGKLVPGFFGEVYLLGKAKNKVAVAGKFGVGAPVVGVLVEEFAAWGVANLTLLGLAGGLQEDLLCGDLVLVESAVRDEGTSHHYLPDTSTVSASPQLVQVLEKAAGRSQLPLRKGPTWTTDAPYRETAAAVAHYQAQGVQTVEMETAALFAVSQFCGVAAGAILAVSDSLARGRWQAAPEPEKPDRHLRLAFDAIVRHLVDTL